MIFPPHKIFFADQIKQSEMGGTCDNYGDKRGEYWDLVGKP